MSLMNDALRKKNREMTGIPAALGFSDANQRPQTNRRWFAVLAATVLLTAAALAGIHLMQSAPGTALLVKSPLPARSQPPENRAADTTSTVEHPATTPAAPESPGSAPETNGFGDMPEAAGPTSEPVTPAPAVMVAESAATDLRDGVSEPAAEPADAQPIATAVTTASPSIGAPAAPTPRGPGTVPRAFEPRPDQTVQPEKTQTAAPRPNRPPAALARSRAPSEPTQSVSRRSSGAAVRPTAQSDGDGDLFYNKARAYHRSGRLADAIRLYRQVLISHSSHPGAMLNLAAAYMQKGNFVDAEPLLNRLEQSNPRPQGVLLNLAIAAIGLGAPEKALDYLDRSEELSDASPWEIRFHRAVALARMNRFSEALAHYREAETERPDDPRLQFNLAVTCDALGLYPEALAYYEAFLRKPPEASPTDPETIIQRIRTIRRYLGTAQTPAKGR